MTVPAAIQKVTSDTAIRASAALLCGVVLAATDASVVHIRDGDGSGAIVLTLRAAAGATVSVMPACPIAMGNGIYVDVVSGTAPDVSVIHA